jgi:hypothetical protein
MSNVSDPQRQMAHTQVFGNTDARHFVQTRLDGEVMSNVSDPQRQQVHTQVFGNTDARQFIQTVLDGEVMSNVSKPTHQTSLADIFGNTDATQFVQNVLGVDVQTNLSKQDVDTRSQQTMFANSKIQQTRDEVVHTPYDAPSSTNLHRVEYIHKDPTLTGQLKYSTNVNVSKEAFRNPIEYDETDIKLERTMPQIAHVGTKNVSQTMNAKSGPLNAAYNRLHEKVSHGSFTRNVSKPTTVRGTF